MDQRDLLALLDEFSVSSSEDYHRLPPGRKPYFVKRLYKIFEAGRKDAVADLSQAGGLKFHFATSGDLTSPQSNLPSETFLKKLTFYANRTLVTFPFREITDRKQLRLLRDKSTSQWSEHIFRNREQRPMLLGELRTRRTPMGGYATAAGRAYHIDPAAFDDLLTALSRLRPAIEAGIAHLMPVFPDTKKIIRNKSLGLVSANFQLKELQSQFEESELARANGRVRQGLTQLLLPHLTHVPLERILEIRVKEESIYWEMQRRLESLIHGAVGLESEKKLLSFLREVDEGVRELHRRFEELQSEYRRKEIYMLIKFISVALVLFVPVEAREAIGGVLGGISMFDYFTLREEKAREFYESRGNKFYLPWLVFRAADELSPENGV